jgi:hypothetical protein
MTTQVSNIGQQQVRDEWVAACERLIAQIEQWCSEIGWSVERTELDLSEQSTGPYKVAALRAQLAERIELQVTPIARHVLGAQGRVDIEAWPSLNRIKLVRQSGDIWEIWTDSHVRIRDPWSRQTFENVARDLAAI